MLAQRVRVFLLLAILLLFPLTLSGTTYGQDDKSTQTSGEEKKEPPAAPSVAEIVPLGTQLAERSAALESELTNLFNFSEAQESLDKIAKQTEKLS